MAFSVNSKSISKATNEVFKSKNLYIKRVKGKVQILKCWRTEYKVFNDWNDKAVNSSNSFQLNQNIKSQCNLFFELNVYHGKWTVSI